MSRAMVIGGTGFLGSAIVRELAAHGDHVTVVNRGTAADASAAGMAGVDTLIHAATLGPHWVASTAEAASARERSGNAMRALADAAVSAGVKRFVMISSADVYGAELDGTIAEDHATRESGDLCADLHRDAEELLFATHRAGRVEGAVVRAATCYGAGDRSFLPRLIGDLKDGRSAILGDGSGRPLLCDVAALAVLVRLVAHTAGASGAYHAVDEDCSAGWGDLLRRLQRELGLRTRLRSVPVWAARLAAGAGGLVARLTGGGEPLVTQRVVRLLTARHRLATDRGRALGWQPRADSATGLLECVRVSGP